MFEICFCSWRQMEKTTNEWFLVVRGLRLDNVAQGWQCQFSHSLPAAMTQEAPSWAHECSACVKVFDLTNPNRTTPIRICFREEILKICYLLRQIRRFAPSDWTKAARGRSCRCGGTTSGPPCLCAAPPSPQVRRRPGTAGRTLLRRRFASFSGRHSRKRRGISHMPPRTPGSSTKPNPGTCYWTPLLFQDVTFLRVPLGLSRFVCFSCFPTEFFFPKGGFIYAVSPIASANVGNFVHPHTFVKLWTVTHFLCSCSFVAELRRVEAVLPEDKPLEGNNTNLWAFVRQNATPWHTSWYPTKFETTASFPNHASKFESVPDMSDACLLCWSNFRQPR